MAPTVSGRCSHGTAAASPVAARLRVTARLAAPSGSRPLPAVRASRPQVVSAAVVMVVLAAAVVAVMQSRLTSSPGPGQPPSFRRITACPPAPSL